MPEATNLVPNIGVLLELVEDQARVRVSVSVRARARVRVRVRVRFRVRVRVRVRFRVRVRVSLELVEDQAAAAPALLVRSVVLLNLLPCHNSPTVIRPNPT